MSVFFTRSLRSPFYLLKRVQRNSVTSCGAALTGRLLDLGCGDGPYRDYYNYGSYIGLERVARQNAKVVGEGENIPFKNHSFDSLAATEVLEHIYDFRRCMREMNRVLKESGHAYISVPMSWPLHYEPHDFFRFTKFGIAKSLQEAGFDIVSIDRLGGISVLFGTHLSILLWNVIKRFFKVAGIRWSERIAGMFVLPINLLARALSFLDGCDESIVVGWSVVAEKRVEVSSSEGD